MFTVVLNSRNKDNKDVKDFRERKKVFLVREFEPYMGEREEEVNMYDEFERFVQDGVEGEMLNDIEEIKGNIKHGNMLEILLYQKTPNGWHIITNPFNVTAIDKDYITVKKDGMLLKKYKAKG